MKRKTFILPRELIAEIDRDVELMNSHGSKKTPEIAEFMRLYHDKVGVLGIRRLLKKHFKIDVPKSTARDWRLVAKRELEKV